MQERGLAIWLISRVDMRGEEIMKERGLAIWLISRVISTLDII